MKRKILAIFSMVAIMFICCHMGIKSVKISLSKASSSICFYPDPPTDPDPKPDPEPEPKPGGGYVG